jgi:hypothetical protein
MRARFYVLSAGTDQDIDTIFAGLIQQRIGVLLAVPILFSFSSRPSSSHSEDTYAPRYTPPEACGALEWGRTCSLDSFDSYS